MRYILMCLFAFAIVCFTSFAIWFTAKTLCSPKTTEQTSIYIHQHEGDLIECPYCNLKTAFDLEDVALTWHYEPFLIDSTTVFKLIVDEVGISCANPKCDQVIWFNN